MIKILAVDDMSKWREFHISALNAILKDTEFSLNVKNSAFEAFSFIQETKEPFDLIITDLQMELDFEPEHAGEWLVRNIKELPKCYNSKIIIVSASYDIRFIAEKYNVDYLSKSTLVQNPLVYELKIKEALKL